MEGRLQIQLNEDIYRLGAGDTALAVLDLLLSDRADARDSTAA